MAASLLINKDGKPVNPPPSVSPSNSHHFPIPLYSLTSFPFLLTPHYNCHPFLFISFLNIYIYLPSPPPLPLTPPLSFISLSLPLLYIYLPLQSNSQPHSLFPIPHSTFPILHHPKTSSTITIFSSCIIAGNISSLTV